MRTERNYQLKKLMQIEKKRIVQVSRQERLFQINSPEMNKQVISDDNIYKRTYIDFTMQQSSI